MGLWAWFGLLERVFVVKEPSAMNIEGNSFQGWKTGSLDPLFEH